MVLLAVFSNKLDDKQIANHNEKSLLKNNQLWLNLTTNKLTKRT